MDFFDKLGKKASKTYKVTAEKTGKLAKETKLKFKINDLRSSVIDMYEEIGKKVYEIHEEGKKSVNFEKDLAEEIEKLEKIASEITKLNEECLSLKDKRKCPECYYEVEREANFCSNCGVKLEKEKVAEPELVEEEIDKDENEEKKKEEKEDKKLEHKENKKNNDKKAKDELQKTVEIESSVKENNDKGKKDKKESKE